MNREEFRILIESIGFKLSDTNYNHMYEYKTHRIDLGIDFYDFSIGKKWKIDISYNNLEHIEKEFKKELRSIKLKRILR